MTPHKLTLIRVLTRENQRAQVFPPKPLEDLVSRSGSEPETY